MGLFKRAISLQEAPRGKLGADTSAAGRHEDAVRAQTGFPAGAGPPAETGGQPRALQKPPGPGAAGLEAGRLFAEISGLPEGMEAPLDLFRILQRSFQLTHSALLLFDPLRMVFAPWASAGLDETTLHRLRIPLGFNPKLNQVANGDLLILREEEDLADFSLFFSTREFASLSELAFMPLIFDQKLIALLAVSRMGLPLEGETAELLAQACRAAAPLIHRARELKLIRLKEGRSPEPRQDLQQALQDLQRKVESSRFPLVLIRVSLSRIVETILKKNSFVDDFRLQEDLVRIIASLLAGVGKVFKLDPKGLLLVIHRMPDADPGLLLHHLCLSLRGFFLELAAEPGMQFEERVRIWPTDGTELEGLVRELA
jgi:hypothetical protein